MFAVMVAMSFMPDQQPVMIASLSCLAIILAALIVKRVIREPTR
jgi:hypothetical protein